MKKTSSVAVEFRGSVAIEIPEELPERYRKMFAEMIVLSRVTAQGSAKPQVYDDSGCDSFINAFIKRDEDNPDESLIQQMSYRKLVLLWGQALSMKVTGIWEIYRGPDQHKIAKSQEIIE